MVQRCLAKPPPGEEAPPRSIAVAPIRKQLTKNPEPESPQVAAPQRTTKPASASLKPRAKTTSKVDNRKLPTHKAPKNPVVEELPPHQERRDIPEDSSEDEVVYEKTTKAPASRRGANRSVAHVKLGCTLRS